MKSRWRQFWLLLCLAVALSASRIVADLHDEIPASIVLDRFTVAKNGDTLLLPVKIGEHTHLFLLDTGSTISAFDDSLPRGASRGNEKVLTPEGEIEVKRFDPPKAMIGTIPFYGPGSVVYKDLKPIREVTGYPVMGILGMDFLYAKIIHINFDKGEFLFLKEVPENPGEECPLDVIDYRPFVSVNFLKTGELVYLLDTGAGGLGSGSLKRSSMEVLCKLKKCSEVGKSNVMGFAGQSTQKLYRCPPIWLGSFCVDSPVFGDSVGKQNLLGLGFLSRFIVTFNFPEQKCWLRKGANYSRPDLWGLSGLRLKRIGGKTVVAAVDESSPGKSAGIHEGDCLLAINDQPTDKASMFELRRMLATPGTVSCSILRKESEFVVSLNLR